MTPDRRRRTTLVVASAVTALAGAALLLSPFVEREHEMTSIDDLHVAGVGGRRSLLGGESVQETLDILAHPTLMRGVGGMGGQGRRRLDAVCTTEGHMTRYCNAPRDTYHVTMLPCCRSLVCNMETGTCENPTSG
mmetsp:Transcript_3194/g.8306  ORF Transcript_3194/g.8306 Transcript_3194/m.8306 type:complete len:135 (-) Transcript_3194:112-516(-)